MAISKLMLLLFSFKNEVRNAGSQRILVHFQKCLMVLKELLKVIFRGKKKKLLIFFFGKSPAATRWKKISPHGKPISFLDSRSLVCGGYVTILWVLGFFRVDILRHQSQFLLNRQFKHSYRHQKIVVTTVFLKKRD